MKDFKSGTFISVSSGYKAFQPNYINRKYKFDDTELLVLLEKANLKLGQLEAYAQLVPDIDHFIHLHVLKEATVSSRIEGTQTNIEDVLLREEEIDPEKKDDWQEVNNYIEAMNESLDSLETLPISSRLFKSAHKILLSGVRGENKIPGEFRKSQNWIGGKNIENATFVPPVCQEVENLMGDLEKFLHNDQTGLTHILKIALAHYQFETIHPFLDGNGRIGRLMISLYFIETNVLTKPVLYLSDYFEKNRLDYYDHLTRVRTQNALKQWLKFFLIGIVETAEKSIEGLKRIIALKDNCLHQRIPRLGKKMSSGQVLLNHLFINPIVRVENVSQVTGISPVSAYKLIEDFINLGILKEMTGGRRNRVYKFSEYFDVFK